MFQLRTETSKRIFDGFSSMCIKRERVKMRVLPILANKKYIQNQEPQAQTKNYFAMSRPLTQDKVCFSGITPIISRDEFSVLSKIKNISKVLRENGKSMLVYQAQDYSRNNLPLAILTRQDFNPEKDILSVLDSEELLNNKVVKIFIYDEPNRKCNIIDLKDNLEKEKLDTAHKIKNEGFEQVLFKKRKIEENRKDPYEGAEEFLMSEIEQIEEHTFNSILQTLGATIKSVETI